MIPALGVGRGFAVYGSDIGLSLDQVRNEDKLEDGQNQDRNWEKMSHFARKCNVLRNEMIDGEK